MLLQFVDGLAESIGATEQPDDIRDLSVVGEWRDLQHIRQHELVASLPQGLSGFTLGIPEHGPVPWISRQEQAARLDDGLSVVLAGNLERDLAHIISSIYGSTT